MPRIELTPSQQDHARVVAEKAARVMEEKPEKLRPPDRGDYDHPQDWVSAETISEGEWWACGLVETWRPSAPDSRDVVAWYPRFSLDGTDPDADAIATARMKERLIELGNSFSVSYCPSSFLNPWGVSTGGWENSIRHAPLEVLAVAQALIAVDEERRK